MLAYLNIKFLFKNDKIVKQVHLTCSDNLSMKLDKTDIVKVILNKKMEFGVFVLKLTFPKLINPSFLAMQLATLCAFGACLL